MDLGGRAESSRHVDVKEIRSDPNSEADPNSSVLPVVADTLANAVTMIGPTSVRRRLLYGAGGSRRGQAHTPAATRLPVALRKCAFVDEGS